MPPRKRSPDELTLVSEPRLTAEQLDRWREAVELFDQREYWLAHERWEEIWRAMGDEHGDDAEIVLRGFIQLAAALHLASLGRLEGARSNFEKARRKLALSPPTFLGIDVGNIRSMLPRLESMLPDVVHVRLRARMD